MVPLGWMQRVYEGRPGARWAVASARSSASSTASCGIDPAHEQAWRQYARSVLAFSLVCVAFLYALQRLQGLLPLNPAGMKGVRPDIAFNTAWSFVTNTNWQYYVAELTMSYLTQMAGLAVQNFASAAVGMAVAVALVRGFVRSESTASELLGRPRARHALRPGATLARASASCCSRAASCRRSMARRTSHTLGGAEQTIARGPFAGQEAIKELGTNGGGSFNANSSHPTRTRRRSRTCSRSGVSC